MSRWALKFYFGEPASIFINNVYCLTREEGLDYAVDPLLYSSTALNNS